MYFLGIKLYWECLWNPDETATQSQALPISVSLHLQLYTGAFGLEWLCIKVCLVRRWLLRPTGDEACGFSFKSTPIYSFIRYVQEEEDRSSVSFLKIPLFRSAVRPDRHFSYPLREAGCCPCPEQSWAAWCWPSSTAAAECRYRCSARGSWKLSTFPRPCRSRCKGSWRSLAQPGGAASVSISWRCNSHSGGRPAAEPPGQESSRSQRPLQEEAKWNI